MLMAKSATLTKSDPLCLMRSVSTDNTVKLSFRISDESWYESCLLDLPYREIRKVICVSTQLGCPFDCVFCAVGTTPFRRNLTCEEILEQIRCALSDPFWNEREEDFEIAAMGTGEPLCALAEVAAAVSATKSCTPHLKSLNVATVGIPERIREYSSMHIEGVQLNLQLSLHATSNEQRRRIMPRAATINLHEILEACRQFSLSHRNRVVVNYLLLKDFNDSASDAARLADLLDPALFSVKVSVLNAAPHLTFKAAERRELREFCSMLQQSGLAARVFTSAGVDIGAGCGQFSNLAAAD